MNTVQQPTPEITQTAEEKESTEDSTEEIEEVSKEKSERQVFEERINLLEQRLTFTSSSADILLKGNSKETGINEFLKASAKGELETAELKTVLSSFEGRAEKLKVDAVDMLTTLNKLNKTINGSKLKVNERNNLLKRSSLLIPKLRILTKRANEILTKINV